MYESRSSESEVLKNVLKPLLEDFQYWFERSHNLLEQENVTFLTDQQQSDLLGRIEQAQHEVNSAKAMFQVLDGQAGIEMSVLLPWHQLLTECWKVSARFRAEQLTGKES
ncbi:MAG: DUF2605 domain-containing protein [Oscillatoriales cyanobacterium RM1_1_9]|nr:DUF2605 domain-containing protein [Oscillatoriales cyanobacterium SM2_3_0]NJO47434.1 DUF2605 domain-containing protein [Oscillatoriales cyanobacterium RM2_1_1]NJO70923.1 DUF2605 domain-containing protein [Oscillatoriales cyanobacterium RM1_1_9]